MAGAPRLVETWPSVDVTERAHKMTSAHAVVPQLGDRTSTCTVLSARPAPELYCATRLEAAIHVESI